MGQGESPRKRTSSEPCGHAGSNDPSAVSPVDLEVTVECQKDRAGDLLAHSDEASVGQRHRNISVTREEPSDGSTFGLQVKGETQKSALDQLQDSLSSPTCVSQQEANFRENRLASADRRLDPGEDFQGPCVVPVVSVQESDERARIDQNRLTHSP